MRASPRYGILAPTRRAPSPRFVPRRTIMTNSSEPVRSASCFSPAAPAVDGDAQRAAPVLQQLFELLPQTELAGFYDASAQTWSHRDCAQMSPVKNNKEM